MMTDTSNPIECCGELHHTKYCPTCGARLNFSWPLAWLKESCTANAENNFECVHRAKLRGDTAAVKKHINLARKWESWARQLGELLFDSERGS